MRVLFAVSEVVPYSKTGGLADVAGALPKALAGLGHEVLVVTPWYPDLGGEAAPSWIGDVEVFFDGEAAPVGVGTLDAGGVRFAFVGHDDFRRDTIYGFADDPRRFARFTRAVPVVADHVEFRPDVVHAHDWHTGFLPALLARGPGLPGGLAGTATVFTLHNVQHQGRAPLADTLRALDLELPREAVAVDGQANPLAAGVAYADRVTTVSPTYAREITEPTYAYGLEAHFRRAAPKLTGILNGLDTEVWDPAHDPHLPAAFDAQRQTGKATVKRAVVDELGLTPEAPLLGLVSRFAEQKGIDLLLDAAPQLLADGWTLALLGTGDPALVDRARELAVAHPDAVAVRTGVSERLAHRIYAASDAFAVPSRFEPCGLSQLIAMRYGSLPIVRDTGGLRDTVEDERTGFVFVEPSADAFARAAARARAALRDGRAAGMRDEAMRRDFGWTRSARAYEALYREISTPEAEAP